MKQNIFIAILAAMLCAIGTNAFAQDVIHTLENQNIEAVVLEIGDDYLLYKAFNNQEGPDYRMSLSRVYSITFENGTEQHFNQFNPIAGSPYSYRDDYYCYPLDYRWGHYYDRYGRISSDNLANYIGISLYGSQYMKARNQYEWGFWLTTGGAILTLFSAVCIAESKSSDKWAESHGMGGFYDSGVYTPTLVAGVAAVGAGIPLWIKGNKGLHRIADDYNARQNNLGSTYQPSLYFGSTASGVGIALKF